MTRVLVLRPEPGATATAERAAALGLEAVALPLFEVEPVEWQIPQPADYDALLLTSANAVRHGGDRLRALSDLQVYAVGEATARAARDAGLEVASVGDGGVHRLLEAISPELSLLHLTGEDRIRPDAPQRITQVVVYRAREVPHPGNIPNDSVALIHSPRAGRRFAELVDDRSRLAIAAISRDAADAVGGGWFSVEATDTPSDDALLALAARLCNKQQA